MMIFPNESNTVIFNDANTIIIIVVTIDPSIKSNIIVDSQYGKIRQPITFSPYFNLFSLS